MEELFFAINPRDRSFPGGGGGGDISKYTDII
jgi:hypothetical protein